MQDINIILQFNYNSHTHSIPQINLTVEVRMTLACPISMLCLDRLE